MTTNNNNRSSDNGATSSSGGEYHNLFNYHDAVIYPSDLEILDSPKAWLNDAVIHFQMTRLQHRRRNDDEYHSSHARHRNDDDDDEKNATENLFLDPSVISFVMHQLIREDYNDDYEEYRNELMNLNSSWKLPSAASFSSLPPPPSSSSTMSYSNYHHHCDAQSDKESGIVVAHRRRRIFIPICDQFGSSSSRVEFAKPGGGTHWSLLVWEVIARYHHHHPPRGNNHVQFISSFSHFDSSSGYNADAAQKVAERLGVDVLLQCWGTDDDDDDNFHVWMEGGDPYVVNVVECCQIPQQNNGYDCGLFALGFAEAISLASMEQLYPDGKIDRATKKEEYEAIVRAHFEKNGGPEAYAARLRRRIGDDIRKLASRR